MMSRKIRRIARPLNARQQQDGLSLLLVVSRLFGLIYLPFLLNACVAAIEDMTEVLPPKATSGLATTANLASVAPFGDNELDTTYTFNPSPAFWRPLSSFPSSSFPPYDMGHHPHSPHRIIYASCNRQPEGLDAKHDTEGRRVWKYISRRKPHAFLWMGDNVYADHMQLPTASDSRNFLWKLSEGKKPIPPPGLIAAYRSQLANKEYTEFLREVPNIAGTWDDHDMGEDNADKMYTFKYESKEAMLNFLGVDETAAIRSLDWKGVYSSHEIYMGEDLSVKVIFLDLRFEKDSWWLMDMGDMLGEQQWAWLQHELQSSTADVNVVVSSLQAFANHRLVTETWSHFPWARERLFALLAGSGAKTPIVLSGDTHFAEFAAMHCQSLPVDWCLNEPEARSYLTASHSRTTGSLTPLQQVRRLADPDADEFNLNVENGQKEGANVGNDCDASEQCCTLPPRQSQLFWWIPRHLPFFLLALFRAAAIPNVFAPRQEWRRPRAPAYRGAFPPPPFANDNSQQNELLKEDRSSLYLFDMTSSGLGHGVPESICRAAPAMVELAAYLLTEGVPFASSLNADTTGPRLLYTERNFGELEFIENPLQLILFPSANDRPRDELGRQEYLQQLSTGNAAWRVQLLRVREKREALRRLHRKLQQKRPLHAHRQLTLSQATKLRIQLQTYKKQRESLVNELISKPAQQLAIVERIVTLTRDFEAYTQTAVGGNAIFFHRLLQLHSALLLAHACEGEGTGHSGIDLPPRSNLLFTSCSLLTSWQPNSRPSAAGSFTDATLWWLWDRMFGLTSRREAFTSALPFGDAATLRLSAAADQLTRMAATARAAGIARLAESRRLLPSEFISIRLREPELSHPLRMKGNGKDSRLLLLYVFSAASDKLLRQACLQLQSSRRQQQREEMDQLFQRGVANQPADPFAFADLGPDLQLVCSLVSIPGGKRRKRPSETRFAASDAAHFAADRVASALAESWVLVELLETKTWILSRTFDAVSGRLAKEKLLSSFASEQRQHQAGIGQWTCQGWKGPSESRMYLCHLCVLGASLLALAAIVIIIIVLLLFAFKAASLILASLGKLCRSSCGISNGHAYGSGEGRHKKPYMRRKILTLKVAAFAGVIMTTESG